MNAEFVGRWRRWVMVAVVTACGDAKASDTTRKCFTGFVSPGHRLEGTAP